MIGSRRHAPGARASRSPGRRRRCCARLRAVPRHRRHAAELAPTPERVRIDDDIAQPAAAARARAGRRARADHRPRDHRRRSAVPGLKLPIAGQHGCERRDADGAIHLHAPRHGDATHKLRELSPTSRARHDGLLLEDKGVDARAALPRCAASRVARASDAARTSMASEDDRRLRAAARARCWSSAARRPRQGHGDPRLHGRAAVRGPPARVRRRRSHRRARLRVVDALGGWSIKVGPGAPGALPPAQRRRRATLAALGTALGDRHRSGASRLTSYANAGRSNHPLDCADADTPAARCGARRDDGRRAARDRATARVLVRGQRDRGRRTAPMRCRARADEVIDCRGMSCCPASSTRITTCSRR